MINPVGNLWRVRFKWSAINYHCHFFFFFRGLNFWETKTDNFVTWMQSLCQYWICTLLRHLILISELNNSEWKSGREIGRTRIMKAIGVVERRGEQKTHHKFSLDLCCSGLVQAITPWILFSLHVNCKKLLCFAFINLEKEFDCTPRQVLRQAMRSLGVEEWAMFSRVCTQMPIMLPIHWGDLCGLGTQPNSFTIERLVTLK